MASRRIAGITIEIDGNATKLNSALKSVDSQLAKTKAALKDTNRLLKLDPKNTELITQKQKLLQQAISTTKERLAQLKSVQKDSLTTDEWDALQREIAATETDLKSLEGEYATFKTNAGLNLEAVSEKLKTLGTKCQEVGKSLTTYVTVPVVAAGTAAVKKYAEVDKTMTLVNKTMGSTEEEAELLNKAMKTAASNSTFGMSDAANASLNFARAGLKAEQAASTLAPAMNLAAGEGGDLDTVSQGLVSTINGFQDTFDNASDYADIFATACNESALDVDSLSDSMGVAAPTFKAAGYSVKDAALYMGIMANNGVNANKSSKALRTGLARLAKPPKEAAEAMEDLGIEVFNADGSMKSSVEVQKILNQSFAKLTAKEKLAAAAALFGKNQMAPWLSLISTAPEEVDKLATSLDNSTGTTNEMAEAMMSGFGGSIEKLKSSIDVLMTTLGELASTYLQPVIDKAQKATEWFMSLDKSQQDLIVKIAGIAAAAGPLLIIIGKFATSISSIIDVAGKAKTALSGASGLAGALKTLVGGFNPVVIGIAAAIAIGVLLWKNWDKIKEKAKQLGKFLQKTWEGIKKTAEKLWGGVKKTVSDAWTGIKSTVSNAAENVKNTVSSAWTNIKSGVSNAWLNIKNAVSKGVSTVKTAVSNKFNEIKSAISTAWTNIKNTATSMWSNIKGAVSTGVSNVKNAVSKKFGEIKSGISNAWNSIKSKATTSWNNIKTAVAGVAEKLRSSLTSKFNSAGSSIVSKFNTVKSTVTSTVSSIASSVKTKFSKLKENIASAFSKIKVSDPFGELRRAAEGVIKTIKGLFNIKLSFPKFTLPHFSVSGKFSLNPPQVPKLDVKWYKKAYDNPFLFTKPTVLQTPAGAKGFGDGSGGEMVYGHRQLMRDIAAAKGGEVTINVYATEGMDVNALADKISDRFVALQRQQERVWA